MLNALEAEAKDADAAAPSSTLNTLSGLLEEEFGPAWEIPIVVRTRPSGAWAASQDPYIIFCPSFSANAPHELHLKIPKSLLVHPLDQMVSWHVATQALQLERRNMPPRFPSDPAYGLLQARAVAGH